MGTHRKTLLDDFSTLMTFLAGETPGRSNDFMPSTCSLGTEYIEERAPTGIHDGFGEMMVLYHITDSQVFYHNAMIAFGIGLGCLEMMISPLSIDFQMRLCHVLGSLPPAMAPFLAPGQLALLASKRFLRGAIKAWVVNSMAFTISQEGLQTYINANGRMITSGRKMLCVRTGFADNQSIPMSIGPQDEVNRLGIALYRAMPLHLEEVSQFLGNNQVFLVFVQRAVFAILTKLDGMPLVALFEARETSFQSKLFAGKKTLEGLGETICQHLDGCSGDRLTATAFKLCGQIVLCRECAIVLILRFHGLKHLIIDEARLMQALSEQSVLVLIDEKAILKRFHDSNYSGVESVCQQFRPPAGRRQFIPIAEARALLPLYGSVEVNLSLRCVGAKVVVRYIQTGSAMARSCASRRGGRL